MKSILMIAVIFGLTYWAMATSVKNDKKVEQIYQQCDWVYTVSGESVCKQ